MVNTTPKPTSEPKPEASKKAVVTKKLVKKPVKPVTTQAPDAVENTTKIVKTVTTTAPNSVENTTKPVNTNPVKAVPNKAVKPVKVKTEPVSVDVAPVLSNDETAKVVKIHIKSEKKAVKSKGTTNETSVVEDKPIRKINDKPVLSALMGINISPTKVKNIISNYVLNKDVFEAVQELKSARPYKVTKLVDNKEVVDEFKGTPINELSQKTLDFISNANKEYESGNRTEFAKTKIASMSEDDRKAFHTLRNTAREEHDKKHSEKYLESVPAFDVEAFNTLYNAEFYKDCLHPTPQSDSDVWKTSIDKVNKLKNRFSTNSRVFISAFIENVIKQLVLNGTMCCVADKKKIIQLSHILDTSNEGFNERFPLYPLIANLDTFKQAREYLNKSQSNKVSESADVVDKSEPELVKHVHDKDTDIFKLDGVSLDVQYQFRYYIAEICREIRMNLATTEVDADGKHMDVYNYTSVSKVFKNFCSTLICEFLIRIGKMLLTEIKAHGIKTVNDSIVSTIISHYHIICGVDKTNTVAFIQDVTSKYYTYVSDRHQKRKDVKDTTNNTTDTLKYTE